MVFALDGDRIAGITGFADRELFDGPRARRRARRIQKLVRPAQFQRKIPRLPCAGSTTKGGQDASHPENHARAGACRRHGADGGRARAGHGERDRSTRSRTPPRGTRSRSSTGRERIAHRRRRGRNRRARVGSRPRLAGRGRPRRSPLFAVNAGSNTISALRSGPGEAAPHRHDRLAVSARSA